MLLLSIKLLWNRLKLAAVWACNCLKSTPWDPVPAQLFLLVYAEE